MSLNDIQLSPAVVAGLYTSSIVLEDQALATPKIHSGSIPTIASTSAPSSIKSLGDNRKFVLIMVDYAETAILPDAELEFLTKLLAACKMDLGDVVIVNRNSIPDAKAVDLLAKFRSKSILLFGIEPAAFGLPVNFPAYQVQTVAGGTYLYAPELGERNHDELYKSRLWVSLKKMFHL